MISDTFRGSVIAALVLTLAIAVPLYVRMQFMGGAPTREDGALDVASIKSAGADLFSPPANLRGSLK